MENWGSNPPPGSPAMTWYPGYLGLITQQSSDQYDTRGYWVALGKGLEEGCNGAAKKQTCMSDEANSESWLYVWVETMLQSYMNSEHQFILLVTARVEKCPKSVDSLLRHQAAAQPVKS